MRAVTGSVASSRAISLSKAAAVLARFTAGQTAAARPDVSAFVRRASAAFDELVIFHRAARRHPELHATENSKEEVEKWKSRDDPQIGKKEKKKQHRGKGFLEEGIRHHSDGVELQEDGKGRRKKMKPEVEEAILHRNPTQYSLAGAELPELEGQIDHHKKKRKKRERDL